MPFALDVLTSSCIIPIPDMTHALRNWSSRADPAPMPLDPELTASRDTDALPPSRRAPHSAPTTLPVRSVATNCPSGHCARKNPTTSGAK